MLLLLFARKNISMLSFTGLPVTAAWFSAEKEWKYLDCIQRYISQQNVYINFITVSHMVWLIISVLSVERCYELVSAKTNRTWRHMEDESSGRIYKRRSYCREVEMRSLVSECVLSAWFRLNKNCNVLFLSFHFGFVSWYLPVILGRNQC